MTLQTWSPSSCDCIIIENVKLDGTKTISGYKNKCNLHKNKSGKTLYDDVLLHNKRFSGQSEFGLNDPTKEQLENLVKKQLDEKERIRKIDS